MANVDVSFAGFEALRRQIEGLNSPQEKAGLHGRVRRIVGAGVLTKSD